MPEVTGGLPQVYSPLNHEIPHNDPKYGYFELRRGTPDVNGYKDKPIATVLAARHKDEKQRVVLEIGKPEDFGLQTDSAEMLIINREQFEKSDGEKGFKGLRDGETVVIGRETPGRFDLPDSVSRQHVKIERVGKEIKITDLGSTNGTALRLAKNPPPSSR